VHGDRGPIRRVLVQQHHHRPVVGERRRPDLVYIDDPRLSPSYASFSLALLFAVLVDSSPQHLFTGI
jgi:hypothetical protein